jgi:energy-coupling factor transporter ATP-binding protein EcfA2
VERLSGGETILVALAALFLRRPDIMLLDEPTNNLDLDARRRFGLSRVGRHQRSPLDCVGAPGLRVRCLWGMG